MVENKNDIFSAAGHVDEELTPFDVRDSSNRSGIIKLGLGFLFLLALALIILKAYQPGVRDRDAPPKIMADTTPFKIEPEDAGGIETPNQDKTIYDVMDGKKPDETISTAPEAEVPIELPKAANIQVDPPILAAPTPKPKQPVVKRPVVIKSEPAAPRPTTTSRPISGGGDYVVQVASVRSESAAQDIWNKTEAKFGDVIGSNMYADIKYADLAEKGIYYRLRVAGISSKEAASRLCEQFKARDQACFVTRK